MITLPQKELGNGTRCFIVAEISSNHHQKYEEAEALVYAAKEAGADAVKLQTLKPESITLNSHQDYFKVQGRDQPHSWQGKTLYELYLKAYTPWEWQPKLKKLADELGIVLFSSPFDEQAVDFLDKELSVDVYKVASYEAVHIPLLRKVAAMHKPVILSIGFANEEEIRLAINTLKNNGASNIIVLHCVTAYSDQPKLSEMNLVTIDDLRKRFGTSAGFSDNNQGIIAPIIAAVDHKAVVIEKHLTLSRNLGGPDARFSLEPAELREMVMRIRKGEKEGLAAALEELCSLDQANLAKGKVNYGPASVQENENIKFRPSIWVKKEMSKGEIFSPENICVARPFHGLAPKFWDEIIGKVAQTEIAAATPMSWDLIKQ